MQSKNRSDHDEIGTNADRLDYDDLKSKTNTELLEEIEALMNPERVEEMDTDRIERCLTLLQEQAPVTERYDPAAGWEKLREDHPLLFEEDEPTCAPERGADKSAKRLRWKNLSLGLRTAAIAVITMFLLVVAANAFGVNPVISVWNWGKGVIQMYSNPSGLMELPADDPSEYHSLEAALETNGVDSKDCPNWVPRDYTLVYVKVQNVENATKYSATYEADRGDFLIRVMQYSDSEWASFEESEDEGTLYVHNEVEYRIVTNYDNSKAEWKLGSTSFMISGQISESELIKMIDSI